MTAIFVVLMLALAACGNGEVDGDGEPDGVGVDTPGEEVGEDDDPADVVVEGPVTANWYPGLLGQNLRRSFIDTYTTTDVETIEQFDNPRFTEMQANRQNPTSDIGMYIDPLMPLVAESGLIEPLDESRIPNLADLDPEVRVSGDPYVPVTYGAWGIVYNAEEITEPINSWADLYREDLEGRVSAPNITYNSSLMTLDALSRLEGGDITDPQAGYEGHRRIRQSGPGLWDTESVAVGWLKTGEIWATPWFSGNALALTDDPDVPELRFVVPDEGAYYVSFNVTMVADAPNPDGAADFINHMLSPRAQEAWALIGRARPVHADVPLPPEVEETVPHTSELLHLDWGYFAENRDDIVNDWNRVVN